MFVLTLSVEIIIIIDLGVNFEQNCRNGLWCYNIGICEVIKKFVGEGSTWKRELFMLKIFLGKGWCNLQFSSFKISLNKIDFNGRISLYNIKPKENSNVQVILEITIPIELKFSILFLPLILLLCVNWNGHYYCNDIIAAFQTNWPIDCKFPHT